MKEEDLRARSAACEGSVETREYSVGYTDSEGKEIVLYGQLCAPKGEKKCPAVLFSHGFNGHYYDFSEECRILAARGFICYSFDYCGAQSGGRSKGRTAAEYTPFTMKEDLCAAVAEIGALGNVDGRIFLFGGSQGGFVAALTAADEEIGRKITAVALYYPAFNIPDDWRIAPLADTPLMGYSVGKKYLESIRRFDPFAVIGGYRGDVCIVWGDRDGLVARRYIDRAVEIYGARAKLTVIRGAGHGFSGAALDLAAEKACSFLEAHLTPDGANNP